jgi:hypothetical protein
MLPACFFSDRLDGCAAVVSLPCPITNTLKIPTRVGYIRKHVVTIDTRVVARPQRRHVTSAHYILSDLLDAVP